MSINYKDLGKNDHVQRFFVSFLMLIISLTAIVITYKYLKVPVQNNNEVINQIKDAIVSVEQEKIPAQYPDYYGLEKMKKVVLISNFDSWTPDAKKNPSLTKKVLVLEGGKLAQGYLYVKASVEGGQMTRWESIFVQMNYRGGHLLRNKSLPVPTGDVTELLYALDDVSYIVKVPYQENSNYNKIDWFNLFKPNSKIVVDTFISSLKQARIEEMLIFYDCVANDQCNLSVVEK